MATRGGLTRALAVIGTLLVWFPILATVVTGAIGTIESGRLLVDYLMPAELFLFALVGGLLLLWAALRARTRRALIAWALIAAVVLLMGGQALAVVTGLASGETEATGWPWAAVVAALALFEVTLVVIAVASILLLCDLFRPADQGASPPTSA